MAKKKAKKASSKSDFIRSLPADLSPVQVIAKGKEAGLSISKALIYIVRTGWKAKTKTKPGAKKKASTSKASASKASASKAAPAASPAKVVHTGKMSASDFIRAQPATMSARKVAEEAAKHGHKFKAQYVYKVRRHKLKRAPKAHVATAAKGAAHAAAPVAHHLKKASPTAKEAMRNLMIEIGTAGFQTLAAQVQRELRNSGHT